ncbi:hypothetical protein PRIPAC_89010 [Pristionchus pacificus]|nr:hypothetical protein PRIPAC_89010 [Pristionchus pacificus]
MSFDNSVAIAFVITSEVLMYGTLPLHARLLYVLLRPSSKKDLDKSFHTLMINTTIANLLFSLDVCLILEPSASGIFFDFYNMMGPYFAKVELIKTTVLLFIGDIIHLLLAINRFSAIAIPLRHQKWWQGNTLRWFCVAMWTGAALFCIPLLLPGSTAHTIEVNLYSKPSVEYTFLGNYYTIYSMGCSFGGAIIEIAAILFYIAMLFKFSKFSKYTQSGAAEVRRMTRGVLRTTLAACCISMGKDYDYVLNGKSSWFLVIFMLLIYISWWTRGMPLIIGNHFSATFRLINAFNNILTPWVMLVSFDNVRRLIFNSKARPKAIGATASSGLVTKY